MQRAQYVRLYADERGESHFEDVDVSLAPVDFAPLAAPLNIAPLFAATRCFLVGAPPDWAGSIPHPTPRRQLFCTMQGEFEVTASDGTVRRFSQGSFLLLEDTTGTGHGTQVIGTSDVLIVAVEVAEH
jgi:hypothetical protein